MDGKPTFVDTNVLIYASQKQSRFHAQAVTHLEETRQAGQKLWISRQVLREYLSVVTRPQSGQAPLSMSLAIADVQSFERAFNVAEDGPDIFRKLTELLAQVPTGGKQVHDANLVATMLTYGITRLLTFNVADLRRFSPWVEIITP